MISIDSISFDTTDWTSHDNKPEQKVWVNPNFQDVLSLHYFAIPPDIPANLSNIAVIQKNVIENITPAKGELVEIEVEIIDGIDALRQIMKFPMNPDGRGRVYLGTWIFPFAQFSYVIKVQCREVGITGMRESMTMAKLMNEGKIKFDVPKNHTGAPVPMPPEHVALISKTSDDVTNDTTFPDHPLSRTRRYFEQLRPTLKVTDEVRKAAPFRI